MEKQNERVFAYQLAKSISRDELAHVAGGVSPQVTHRETVKATGLSEPGVDAAIDGAVDW